MAIGGEKHIDVAPKEATRESPLMGRGPSLLPPFVITPPQAGSDLNVASSASKLTPVPNLVEALNEQGWWPVELRTTSHPYQGAGPAEPPPDFVDRGQVGDAWDTSPFTEEHGPMGISTGTYINNMSRLIAWLVEAGAAVSPTENHGAGR